MEKLSPPVISKEAIDARITSLAAEIDTAYKGQPLVLVCVLKGAFIFFADLARRLTVCPEVDFVRVASYGLCSESSRDIRFTKDIELPIEGKHVLLVDDIIDTGHTMQFLKGQFAARGATSLRVAALVDKAARREASVAVDFVGFPLEDGFLVGYGLDYAEKYRYLPAIHVLEFE